MQGRRPYRRPRNKLELSAGGAAPGPTTLKPALTPTASGAATPSGVATPQLTEAVPSDTPRFADLNANGVIVDPILIDTITKDLGFVHMMPVQAATIHELLPPKRHDALVQAKTGTGKTIGFLLPAIQTLMNKTQGAISLLVMAPTRELAMQIAKEAKNLLKNLPAYRVCIAVGGTNKNREEREILNGCDILVSTPGRMLDHLGTPGIQQALQHLDTLVLDEADRLLDMGFLPALKSILAYLPDKAKTKRQGMLFSATVPSHVAQVASLVLSPGYRSISTIAAGEASTHARVTQLLVQVPTFADLAPALVGAIRREMREMGAGAAVFKSIVFAQTAAQADFYGYLLAELPGMPPSWTLHARHAQSKRTNITSAFRSAATGILVATDVVARGMDFPAVTTVIQVGLPMDKESYIHRLGRTARGAVNTADGAAGDAADGAASVGRGVFLVTEAESFFPTRVLRQIEFVRAEPDLTAAAELEPIIHRMGDAQVAKIYQAWLGYYNGHMKSMRWDKAQLVEAANTFAWDGLGATSTPTIQKTTVGKMGLRGTPGLVVVADAPRAPRGPGRGAGGGGGGRGGGGAGAGPAAGGRAANGAQAGPGGGNGEAGKSGGGGAGSGSGQGRRGRGGRGRGGGK